MSQHTPGPWKQHDQGRTVVQERAAFDLVIANLSEPDHGSRIANARLIAAAPEMYAILQTVAEFHDLAQQENDPILLTFTRKAKVLLAQIDERNRAVEIEGQ